MLLSLIKSLRRNLGPLALASCALLILPACGDDDGSTSDNSGGNGGSGASGGAGGGGEGGMAPTPAETLALHLIGRFDSVDQAQADPANYLEIQLETCEVPASELGEHVLYVEQAAMSSLNAPYRQRLYVVEPGTDPATQAQTTVYELTTPSAFIGRCDDPMQSPVGAVQAIERVGCGVFLTWMGDHFEGGTEGKNCESSLQGATYATSEVDTYEDRIESWDRGYDAADMQVWGAVPGPYLFIRRTPYGEMP